MATTKEEVLEKVANHTTPHIPTLQSQDTRPPLANNINDSDNDSEEEVFHPAQSKPDMTSHGSEWVDKVTEGLEKTDIKDIDERFLVTMGMSVEDIEASQVKAEECKKDGNVKFSSGCYDDAIELYSQALSLSPVDYKPRSVFYSNRAACHMKLGAHEKAIEDCTKAIGLDPTYIKALLRRAQSYEAVDKLEDSLDDYKKVVELDPTCRVAIDKVRSLPAAINEKNERLKNEMLGKLKEMGNSLLGKFGMSLDNFKMEQKPDGSYSVNFNQDGK